MPPGQFLSNKFPALTYGSPPQVDLKTWKIRVFGLVEREIKLDWVQFTKLDWVKLTADFHCVTQWSSLDNNWEGVLFSTLVAPARPEAQALYPGPATPIRPAGRTATYKADGSRYRI